MRLRGVMVVGLGLMAAVLAACGDDDEPGLSREAFLERGNAICKQSEDRIRQAADALFPGGEIPAPDKVEVFAERTVVPEIERQVEELEKLKPTDRDREQVDDIIESAKDGADMVDDDPTSILSNESNPLLEYEDRANGFGLTACADATERITRVLTGVQREG